MVNHDQGGKQPRYDTLRCRDVGRADFVAGLFGASAPHVDKGACAGLAACMSTTPSTTAIDWISPIGCYVGMRISKPTAMRTMFMTMTGVVVLAGLLMGAGCGSDDDDYSIDPGLLEACGGHSSSTNNDDCMIDWNGCEDGAAYSVDCTAGSAGVSCVCSVNGSPAGGFIDNDICGLEPADQAANAALGCDF